MFPIRCYTCNLLVAHKYPEYRSAIIRGEIPKQTMAELQVERICCRRMFLGYVDLVEDLIAYPSVDQDMDESGTRLLRHARIEREVTCE